jgi:hypothetical protein
MRQLLLAPGPLLAVCLSLGACASPEDDPSRRFSTDASSAVLDARYYEDVRPILVAQCNECHADGGIAPFSLTTYEEVRTQADRILDATHEGRMPPFYADTSGACQTFANARGLTAEEQATLDAWVAAGMPEGDPTTAMPELPEPAALPSIDATLAMPATYAIDDRVDDDYRCFVVDGGFEGTAFATGYDVHPGNPERVHHVIVYVPDSDEAAARAQELDAEQGEVGDGYRCYGAANVSAFPLVIWAPGTPPTSFPTGTGVRVDGDRPFIVQIHYNNLVEGAPNEDLTTVDLSLAPSANRAYIAPLAHAGINLPPRMPEVVQSTSLSLSFSPVPLRIWGVFPHMHTLGRRLSVEIERDGGADECLIDMRRWDFDWQLSYWLSEPMRVTPQDAARITCTYDTRTRDETTRWGEGTLDEMCLAFVYATL